MARSLVIGAQMRPRPKRIIKLMLAAVAFLRGEDEIALVFALGVVNHDDRLARADVAQDGIDRTRYRVRAF